MAVKRKGKPVTATQKLRPNKAVASKLQTLRADLVAARSTIRDLEGDGESLRDELRIAQEQIVELQEKQSDVSEENIDLRSQLVNAQKDAAYNEGLGDGRTESIDRSDRMMDTLARSFSDTTSAMTAIVAMAMHGRQKPDMQEQK